MEDNKPFVWINENCNTSWIKNWYLYFNGICNSRIKEHLDGYVAYDQNNLKGVYFDSLIKAKKHSESNVFIIK